MSERRAVLILRELKKNRERKRFVEDGEGFLIRRDTNNALNAMDTAFDDKIVSRQHAHVTYRDGQFNISDWSTTGTFLNGQRLPKSESTTTAFYHGDLITLGDPGRRDCVNLAVTAYDEAQNPLAARPLAALPKYDNSFRVPAERYDWRPALDRGIEALKFHLQGVVVRAEPDLDIYIICPPIISMEFGGLLLQRESLGPGRFPPTKNVLEVGDWLDVEALPLQEGDPVFITHRVIMVRDILPTPVDQSTVFGLYQVNLEFNWPSCVEEEVHAKKEIVLKSTLGVFVIAPAQLLAQFSSAQSPLTFRAKATCSLPDDDTKIWLRLSSATELIEVRHP